MYPGGHCALFTAGMAVAAAGISTISSVATGFIISTSSSTHRRSRVLLPLRFRIRKRLSLRGFVSKSGQPNQGEAYHRCTVGERTLRHIGTLAFASRRHHSMSGLLSTGTVGVGAGAGSVDVGSGGSGSGGTTIMGGAAGPRRTGSRSGTMISGGKLGGSYCCARCCRGARVTAGIPTRLSGS